MRKQNFLCPIEIYRLQKENDNLVGKYSVHSQELQSEMINLPDNIEVSNNFQNSDATKKHFLISKSNIISPLDLSLV